MTEPKTKNLKQKLNAVMAGVGRLNKDGHNAFQNYDYVSETNVVEKVVPLLVENGVTPSVSLKYYWQVERAAKDGGLNVHSFVVLTCRFLDTESDEEMSEDWLGEGQDKGDKGYYKAYTGAQKYWLMKTFLIPTGDDPECDSGKLSPSKPAEKAQPKSPVGNTPTPSEGPAPEKKEYTPGGASSKSLGLARGLFFQLRDSDGPIAIAPENGETPDVTDVRREQNCYAISEWLKKNGFDESTGYDDELFHMDQSTLSKVIDKVKAEIAKMDVG